MKLSPISEIFLVLHPELISQKLAEAVLADLWEHILTRNRGTREQVSKWEGTFTTSDCCGIRLNCPFEKEKEVKKLLDFVKNLPA